MEVRFLGSRQKEDWHCEMEPPINMDCNNQCLPSPSWVPIELCCATAFNQSHQLYSVDWGGGLYSKSLIAAVTGAETCEEKILHET